jgi:PBP1b-binding outer membrane lipoprotein LpoB
MKTYLFLLISTLLFVSCDPAYEPPDSAIDAGRQFIDAVYNGNFKRAKQLLVPVEANETILKEKFEKDFRGRNGFEKTALSKASIQISEIKVVNSNITELQFLNAYSTQEATLEIKNINGEWRVDLTKMP